MNIADNTSNDVNTKGGGIIPPRTRIKSDALPEVQKPILAENSQTGVSTKNALLETLLNFNKKKIRNIPRWYALRVTYGREKKAYEYLVNKKVEVFYPTITTVKLIDGKRKTIEMSRIPNILFARGKEDEIKSFVYDNVNFPHLRFYYRHIHKRAQIFKEPLIVPDVQIEGLKIICASEADDVIIVPSEIQKFQSGQTVRVIDGAFKGVVGKVARYHGQQRVAVIIDGLLSIASAYVPNAFLEPANL